MTLSPKGTLSLCNIFLCMVSVTGVRQWYAVFPLMCVGLLSVKTPTSECLISKTPGSLSNLLTPRIMSTPTCLYNPP